MEQQEKELRETLVESSLELERLGLNRGTSGNLSVRCGTGLLVTPSGLSPAEMTPDSMVHLGADGAWRGAMKPSSEWRFHRGIVEARSDVAAVVHTHSEYATALACQRRSIPAFHYMVAIAGGVDIRCAPYASFGSERLAELAVAALEGRKACLLANHGLIATGSSLAAAVSLAAEIEALAKQYVQLLQMGGPVLLTDEEMADVLQRFASYGAAPRG
ncbi:MAG: class II aldolase/adducin family protein [Acidobacteriota bacterium]